MAEAEAEGGAPAPRPEKQKLVRVRRAPRVPDPAPPLEPPPALVTAADDVPPDEPDAIYQDAPSIGRIEVTDAGKGHLDPDPEPEPEPVPDFVSPGAEPRTFDDLMGMFPVGDASGLYYIYVERKRPHSYSGFATQGVLRKIRKRITLEEFKVEYGGGDYLLTVYGPPRRSRVLDPRTNLPAPKALTKPVRFIVPWSGSGGHPPNPEAGYEEGEEEIMENSQGPFGGGLPHGLMARGTPASAKMYDSHLGFEERREQRQREDRERRRQREESEKQNALDILSRQFEKAEAEKDKLIAELMKKLEAATQNKSTDFEGMAKMMSTMNPRASRDEVESAREAHRREVETLERRHREEVTSLERRHKDEVDRIGTNARADVQRTEDRVTGIETRANERVRDVEQKLEAHILRAREEREAAVNAVKADQARTEEMLRNEHTRQIDALRLSYETQLTSERNASERELRTRSEIAESRRLSDVTRLEADVKRLETDARKRDRDMEDLKRLAERNKDLGKLLEEAEQMATMLGYQKAEPGEGGAEPTDWKSAMATIALEGMKQLPAIIQRAGETVAQLRQGPGAAPGAAQPMPQMMGQPQPRALASSPYAAPRRVFAAEGSGLEPGAPPPYFGNEVPVGAMRPPPLAPDAPPPQAPMPVGEMVAPVAAAPAPAPSVAAPAPSVAPGPPRLPAQASAPALEEPPRTIGIEPRKPDAELGNPEMDQAVLQGKAQLEEYFRARAEPKEIAKALIAQHGAAAVRVFQPMAHVDVVVGALTRSGNASSRLLSYKGRRYLKQIEEALEKALAEAG